MDAKGISGTATLSSPPAQTADISEVPLAGRRQGPGRCRDQAAPGLGKTGADWHDATTATDAFNGRVGSAWFRTTLPDVPGPHRRIHFNSIDDNGPGLFEREEDRLRCRRQCRGRRLAGQRLAGEGNRMCWRSPYRTRRAGAAW